MVGETHLEPYPSGVVHHRMMATTGLRQARWNDAVFFSAQMPAGLHRFMPRPRRSGESQSNVWATHCKTSRASSSRPSDN